MIVFLRPKGKAMLQWENLSLSFENMAICSVYSYSMEPEMKSELGRWALGGNKSSVLSGPWFWRPWVVMEICRSAVETTDGLWHNAITLKIKWFHLRSWNPKRNWKIITRTELIQFHSQDWCTFRMSKKIYKTLRWMCRWEKKMLNWNYLGEDRIVYPFAHHLLPISSPISSSTLLARTT